MGGKKFGERTERDLKEGGGNKRIIRTKNGKRRGGIIKTVGTHRGSASAMVWPCVGKKSPSTSDDGKR